jgi:O-antigen ligase
VGGGGAAGDRIADGGRPLKGAVGTTNSSEAAVQPQLSAETVGADPLSILPTAAERWALRVLQAGAVAVVLAATTHKVFELDRFFVPKELVLHLTALLAGLLVAGAVGRRLAVTRLDLLLAGYLVLGGVSAATATNGWVAARALAISVSGVAVFWVARALREAGLARPLLRVLGVAVVVGAALALLQAYGVRTELFSENRAPGGTLGNRNFVAHLAAFGLPVVLLGSLRAWRPAGYLVGALGVMVVVSSLVLTRSRAGWIAVAVVLVVFLLAMPASPMLRRQARSWVRLAGVLLMIGGGVVAAITLPNTLRWASENPYRESVRGVANYQEGSGRGRLIQYRRSLGMLADRPLLGVGPGNWPVEYPAYAAAGDPSLDQRAAGATSNPWPSSDWIAFVSERGLPAAILLALALFGIAASAVRRLLRARDADEALVATALLATVLAAVVAGAFDAVLLLALPTLLVWAALGALWTPPQLPGGRPRAWPGSVALVVVALAAGMGAARSSGQLASMALYAEGGTAALTRAARLDPGSYRVHLRLAERGGREQRCRHARAAHALFPQARAARDLARGCG